jgi:hypothetical protein
MPEDLACFSLGTPQPTPLTSTCRFPDGGAYRIEIPSVEGPTVLDAVLAESDALFVPIHRVSQGSGVMMLTDAEIGAMVQACAARGSHPGWRGNPRIDGSADLRAHPVRRPGRDDGRRARRAR